MNLSISNFNFLTNMKKSTLKLFLIAFFSGIIIPFNYQSKAGVTQVPACGKDGTPVIPSNNGFCAITPNVFNIELYRAELCINNPMPTGTTTPNYSSSGCITLFDGEGISSTEDIGNNKTASLPSSEFKIVPGTYKYLNLVLGSNFRASASHTYNGITYRSSGTTETYIYNEVETSDTTNVTSTAGTPVVTDRYVGTGDNYSTHGWRSKYGDPSTEEGNRDCQNDGGTKTRCVFSFYYGNNSSTVYNVTAIIGVVGSDGSFTEEVSGNSNSLFYQNELRSPLTLSANSSGFFDIGIKANISVQSNDAENEVMQLNASPISFDMEFIDEGSLGPT